MKYEKNLTFLFYLNVPWIKFVTDIVRDELPMGAHIIRQQKIVQNREVTSLQCR